MPGRRKFFKDFTRGWNWFELTMLAIGIVAPITLGVIFDSGVLYIVTSITFITAMLLIAKARVEGFMMALAAYTMYLVVSFQAGLFGEVITMGLFSIPINTWTVISWLRNRRKKCLKTEKQQASVQIVGVRPKELALLVFSQVLMGVGYYFLLRAFDTNFLIISTLTLAANVMGDYLCARRNILGPFMYVVYDVLTIVLWTLVLLSGSTGAIVILAMQVISFVNDTYGVVNWVRLIRKNR